MKTRLTLSALVFVLIIYLACNEPYKQGAQVYSIYCANCHGEDGMGFAQLYPPINQSTLWDNPAELACVVKYGKPGGSVINGIEYTAAMPAIPEIGHTSMVNLINYLTHRWSQDDHFVSEDDVRTELDKCR